MNPWREIFQVEELSFDELIQRDLDDSRVAHDMIPYLLGETGHHARFFPPILAVLVPRKPVGTGIAPRYPEYKVDGAKETFGDLFDFDQVLIEGQPSPLGVINYNSQKTAMVIVDGQHRAMAVLALHRQLNKSWGSDPFAPYYTHIDVSSQDVAHIDLPVCVIYFPDIHEGNSALTAAGIDLVSVCREIFTVVNKSAKPVGKSRELLLNDEDLSAFMMRRTLTNLKGRKADSADTARIYSFAFGDEENGAGTQVMSGRLEYSSALAIYKMHGAMAFALPAAFAFSKAADVTDGRYVRNPVRPVDLLSGVAEVDDLKTIGKRSAKTHSPALTDVIVDRLGDLTDAVLLPFFDELRPFVAHNLAMRELNEALSDSVAKADLVQSKCRSLLFDGSGTRAVFEEHNERLKARKKELEDIGTELPSHLTQQLAYCDSVLKSLQRHEDTLKSNRAFKLFGIDGTGFQNRDKAEVDKDIKVLRGLAKSIFDTSATQAFQVGYLMAVATVVERMTNPGSAYAERLRNTQFISRLFLDGFNTLFAVGATKHKTMSGYVSDTRAGAFDASHDGFRGLLKSCNVQELNEKQWEFFRYVVLEIVHSKRAFDKVDAVLNDAGWAVQATVYRAVLPGLLADIESLRAAYFSLAARTAINASEFSRKALQVEADARASGKTEAEAKAIVEELHVVRRRESESLSKQHISASLGKVEKTSDVFKRFSVSPAQAQVAGELSPEVVLGDQQASPGDEGLSESDTSVA